MSTTTQFTAQIESFNKSILQNVQPPSTDVVFPKKQFLWQEKKQIPHAQTLIQGTSDDGALYCIGVPKEWNGGILIHCPGFRTMG